MKVRCYPGTRLKPIRTLSEITAYIKILPVKPQTQYEKLSKKVKQLKALGMNIEAIARKLKVSWLTAKRAYLYHKGVEDEA